MILRIWTVNFEADFGDEMSTVQRHMEILKEETTLGHRLHMHKFVADTRLADASSVSVTPPADLEAVR
jgi:hypothetical protein